MTTRFLSLFIILLFSIHTIAQSQDKTKPVINLSEPRDGAVFKIGDAHGIHFLLDMEDETMLGSYSIEVYENFNGIKPADGTTEFSFNKTYDLSGQKTARVHHHDVVIPEKSTPGNYHFIITCKDAAGNRSEVIRNIVLRN